MAALDFPASPIDGQTYSNWVYSSSKGAWQAKPLTPGQAQPSATAPTSPSNGDQWYNTNDGNLYVYYNDGDTSQWVQVKSDATLSSTLGNRVTTLEAYPSGLVPVIPSSITVGSGSASAASSGVITITGASTIALDDLFRSTDTVAEYQISGYLAGASEFGSYLNMAMRSAGGVTYTSHYGMTRYSITTSWGASPSSTATAYSNAAGFSLGFRQYTNFEITIRNPYAVINTEYMARSGTDGSNQLIADFVGRTPQASHTGVYFYNNNGTAMSGWVKVTRSR